MMNKRTDNGKKRNTAAVKITAALCAAYVIIELLLAFDSDVSFNFLRCAIAMCVLTAFGALSYFGLWQVSFDPENKNHGASALALCAVCVILAVILSLALCPQRADVAYPFEYPVEYYDPYEQQFDAFVKGQLEIDVAPSEELAELADGLLGDRAKRAHHNDVEPQTIVAVLVQAADAVSAARPGARREDMENYIKRLQKLEEIAASFQGVDKAFAIQAGREIRVMVKPEIVNDEGMKLIAREMAKKIEDEVKYPGQIKLNLIRETRTVDYAK